MLTVQDKDLGKIPYGEFIKISPTRVPRLIGKRGSMIQTIEQATLTRVIIGQNGIVVVTGRDIDGLSLAVKAIKMVEEESHTNNLTQKVKALLNVQDPAESEKSENINISGDGIASASSQTSNFQSNSSSGLSSGVDSSTMEQQQQPTMEQQQQPTMEQQPQKQNSSNEDPANTTKTDEEQSENQLSDNLTKANQKKKKHDLISEGDE
jgi:exosome complex component RRP4